MRVALTLNKVHGGGMLPWMFGLSPFALTELHRVTMAWLEETSEPDA